MRGSDRRGSLENYVAGEIDKLLDSRAGGL
jgi:hypothetical protein